MSSNNKKMIFRSIDGNHVLQPKNTTAKKAQLYFFEILEKEQEKLINEYENLNDDEKIKRANKLSRLFVDVLMNGDQISFKILLGTGKGLMNAEELKNVRKDMVIAKNKKGLGEFRTFLLLDLLPYSNRRADAIVVSKDYKIELYDFSEGVVASKLRGYMGSIEDLSKNEKIQLHRKNKQNERIVSYKNKIDMNSSELEDIIVDVDKVNIQYYCDKPTLFNFNVAYHQFLKQRRERIYIPGSVCFLSKKNEQKETDLFVFPLKHYIDSPYYTLESRFIANDFIEDIYKNDTNIIFSKYYFFYFFEKFTCFNVILRKKIDSNNGTNQIKLTINGKIKGLNLRDSRTKKYLPITYQLLFKHSFMHLSLRSWCEYISAICNESFNDRKFNQESFYIDRIKAECPFFDIEI